MSYTQHLFNLPNNLIVLVRNLETTRKKICKAEWSKIFNNVISLCETKLTSDIDHLYELNNYNRYNNNKT